MFTTSTLDQFSTALSLRSLGSVSPIVLKALATSILDKGLINPVVVDASGHVVDGYKRLLAIRSLIADNRLKADYQIATLVQTSVATEAQNVATQLEIDKTTTKLNSYDKSRSIALVGKKAVQEATGYTDSTMRVLEGLQTQLAPSVKSLVDRGLMTTTHAIQLKSLGHYEQAIIASRIVAEKLSVRETQEAVRVAKLGSQEAVTRENNILETASSLLGEILGTEKVTAKLGNKGAVTITISVASLADLEKAMQAYYDAMRQEATELYGKDVVDAAHGSLEN